MVQVSIAVDVARLSNIAQQNYPRKYGLRYKMDGTENHDMIRYGLRFEA